MSKVQAYIDAADNFYWNHTRKGTEKDILAYNKSDWGDGLSEFDFDNVEQAIGCGEEAASQLVEQENRPYSRAEELAEDFAMVQLKETGKITGFPQDWDLPPMDYDTLIQEFGEISRDVELAYKRKFNDIAKIS